MEITCSPRPQALDLSSPIITVRVGSDENCKDFSIHEPLLRENSGFFAGALRGGWKESVERIVTMPDESPDHFNDYSSWLYFRKLYGAIDHHDQTRCMEEQQKTHNEEVSRLIRCWILGDRLLDTNFKDAIMDALVQVGKDHKAGLKYVIQRPDVKLVYDRTKLGSPLRRFVVCKFAEEGTSRYFKTFDVPDNPQEYVLELLIRLAELRDGRASLKPYQERECEEFHEHTREGKPCYKTQI